MEYVDITKMTFYEVVSYKKIRQLIRLLSDNPLYFQGRPASWACSYHRVMKTLQALYSRGFVHGNKLIIPVQYCKSSSAPIVDGNIIGRVYPVDDVSCGCLSSELRGSLLKDDYVYLDLSSSHSTILMALCMASGIKCQFLSEYHNNRDSILSKAMDEYGIPRDIAKVAFISCMNMGTYKKWAQKYNITKPEWHFLHHLRCEMQDIIKELKKKYPKYIDAIKDQSRYKHDGVFESWLVQDFEFMILSLICSISPKLAEHAILNFDGIMVLKETYVEGMEEYISKRLCDILNVKVTLKIDDMMFYDLDPYHEEWFEEDNRIIHREKFERDMMLVNTITQLQPEHLRDITTFEGLIECFLRFGMNQCCEEYCAKHSVPKWCSELQMEQLKQVTRADVQRQIWDFLCSV